MAATSGNPTTIDRHPDGSKRCHPRRGGVAAVEQSSLCVRGSIRMSNKDREFRRWLERILRMIVLIKAALARNEWALETVSNELLECKEAFERERSTDVPKSTGEGRAGERAADAGNSSHNKISVRNIIIEHDDDGSMYLHLDDEELAVRLQKRQRLRELVLALSGKTSRANGSDNGPIPLVPFKTCDELIAAMRKLNGTEISHGNLQGLVQQLRTRLADARIDPRIIETGSDERGYRIRLHRDGRIHEHGKQ